MERLKNAILELKPEDALALIDREKGTLEIKVHGNVPSGEKIEELRRLVKIVADQKGMASSYRLTPYREDSGEKARQVIKFTKLSAEAIREADEVFRGKGIRKASIGQKPVKGIWERIFGG